MMVNFKPAEEMRVDVINMPEHRTKKKSESLIGTCGQVCQKGDFDTCLPHTPQLFWMRFHGRNPDFYLSYFPE